MKHMRRYRIYRLPAVALCAAALLALTSCGTLMKARSDFDPSVDFSGYRKFAWMKEDPLIMPNGRAPEVSALNMQRILDATATVLTAKGYTQVESAAQSDFVIAFTVGTRDRLDIDAYPPAYRGRWYWQSLYWETGLRARTYQEGVLSIDIFDQRSRAPVWHGWLSKRITERDRTETPAVIDEAVAAILADFPPGR